MLRSFQYLQRVSGGPQRANPGKNSANGSVQRDQKRQADTKDGNRNQKMSVSNDGARLLDESHPPFTVACGREFAQTEKVGWDDRVCGDGARSNRRSFDSLRFAPVAQDDKSVGEGAFPSMRGKTAHGWGTLIVVVREEGNAGSSAPYASLQSLGMTGGFIE
jgi:hypothetical protein